MDAEAGFLLTKLLLQRGLALVYLVAFLVAAFQFVPLLGEKGLLPVPLFLKQISFSEAPSLFHFIASDAAFKIFAWIGVALAALALTGISEKFGVLWSVVIWSAMWVLYLSFVNVGQTFYAFGWESLLLEAGFLAIFLGPAAAQPSTIMIWLFRWLLFRIMFGAGLIKLRGDECWKDLTCLFYHFETQPMPNPLSWYFHWLPKFFLKAGVLYNHFVELIVPFFYFAPQPFAAIAGILTILFHGALAISGNFSWLSFLTLILAFSTFDDRTLGALLRFTPIPSLTTPLGLQYAAIVLAVIVVVFSIRPVANLLSPRQLMNYCWNPLHFVCTYGAFGSITRPRYEVVVEGTSEEVLSESTVWKEYEFKGKPGRLNRLPPQVAPYHLRLDWLMWFAGFSSWQQHPWFVHLLSKLLANDPAILSLIKENPFSNAPPRHVRARLYEYHFTTPSERAQTEHWWKRTLIREYFPPVSSDDTGFLELLKAYGWSKP